MRDTRILRAPPPGAPFPVPRLQPHGRIRRPCPRCPRHNVSEYEQHTDSSGIRTISLPDGSTSLGLNVLGGRRFTER